MPGSSGENAGLGDRQERQAYCRGDDERQERGEENLHHALLVEIEQVKLLPAPAIGLLAPEAVVERGHER